MAQAPKKPKGRPPVAPDARRSKNFTFRSRAALHQKLGMAAKASGRSISEEIEYRLERSFENERRVYEVFGDRDVYGIMRVIGAAIHEAGSAAGFYATHSLDGAAGWLRQPWAYDQAVKAAMRVFDALRPEGDPSPPEQLEHQNLGRGFASGILNEIARGKARITPDNVARTEELRRELGPLAERLTEAKTGKEDMLFNVQRDDQQQMTVLLTNKKPKGEIL
jgi:hypothetical protein